MKTTITNKAIATMKSITTALALGLAALTLVGTAVAKEQKTRPYLSKSHVEVTVDTSTFPDNVTWTSVISGVATHLGSFTGEGGGVVEIEFCPDGQGGFYVCGVSIIGEGKVTAANGDTVNTVFLNPENSQSGAGLFFSGGTGRFENAEGSAVQTQYNYVETDNGDGTTTISYDDVLEGTITF
jgi:hypothetical protein